MKRAKFTISKKILGRKKKLKMNVEEKIEMLAKRTESVSMLGRKVTEFLSQSAEIRPNLLFPGFYLDDNTLYEEAMAEIEEKDTIIPILLKLVVYMVKKFGLYGDEKSRQDVIFSGESDEDGFLEGVSIQKYIGKNAAMCIERASFLHNALRLLDYDTTLLLGNFQSRGENLNGNHAYNLVVTKNSKYLLVDATNYTQILKDSKKVLVPTILKLTLEEYEGLLSGKTPYQFKKAMHVTKYPIVGNPDWEYC